MIANVVGAMLVAISGSHMWRLEHELLASVDPRSYSEADQRYHSELNAARREGQLETAYEAVRNLLDSQRLDEDDRAYYMVVQYGLERNLQMPKAAAGTADRLLSMYGQDQHISFAVALDKVKMMSQTGPGKDDYRPTFADIERQYEYIFAHFNPYTLGVVGAHTDFAKMAMAEAERNPPMRHYATVAQEHLFEASGILKAVLENPALADDERFVQLADSCSQTLQQLQVELSQTTSRLSKDSQGGSDVLPLQDINVEGRNPDLGADIATVVRSGAYPGSAGGGPAPLDRELVERARADFDRLADEEVLLLATEVHSSGGGERAAAAYGGAALPSLCRLLERDDLTSEQVLNLALWVGGHRSKAAFNALKQRLAFPMPERLTEQDWNALRAVIIGMGGTRQPESLTLLKELLTEDYWIKRSPQHQVPSRQQNSEKTRYVLRTTALDAIAWSGTPEALAVLDYADGVPEDLAGSLPHYRKLCEERMSETAEGSEQP